MACTPPAAPPPPPPPHRPLKSGLPSAVRGVGAAGFAVPPLVCAELVPTALPARNATSERAIATRVIAVSLVGGRGAFGLVLMPEVDLAAVGKREREHVAVGRLV